jgi:hypothetical protein
MAWISPIKFNMDISSAIIEGKSDNIFIDTARKIAIYLVIPMALIATFEAVIKNMIFYNLANGVIVVLNGAYYLACGDPA